MNKATEINETCNHCSGTGRRWVVDRVIQGQSYGPEVEGHYEMCQTCNGSGCLQGSGNDPD